MDHSERFRTVACELTERVVRGFPVDSDTIEFRATVARELEEAYYRMMDTEFHELLAVCDYDGLTQLHERLRRHADGVVDCERFEREIKRLPLGAQSVTREVAEKAEALFLKYFGPR